MTTGKQPTLTPIVEAVSEVDLECGDPNHALVIYQKHYKGRETEVTYQAFLNALCNITQPAKIEQNAD